VDDIAKRNEILSSLHGRESRSLLANVLDEPDLHVRYRSPKTLPSSRPTNEGQVPSISAADNVFLSFKTIFGSGTDFIALVIFLLLLFFFFLLGATSSKKPKAPLFQVGSGRNSAELFFT